LKQRKSLTELGLFQKRALIWSRDGRWTDSWSGSECCW